MPHHGLFQSAHKNLNHLQDPAENKVLHFEVEVRPIFYSATDQWFSNVRMRMFVLFYSVRLGSFYHSGIYLVEIIQGGQKQTLKLVKTN